MSKSMLHIFVWGKMELLAPHPSQLETTTVLRLSTVNFQSDLPATNHFWSIPVLEVKCSIVQKNLLGEALDSLPAP